jgi:4-diphosphocytidyl-2-C-methyl-D-erythritol kinase
VLITEQARAKVNLTLQVLGRRPDGYHELASLVGFASAADVVTLDVGRDLAVEVVGPFGGRISSENLITHTLRKLREAEPRLVLGSVRLEKQLPVAAGIGGGSADAAAVLRAVRRANAELAGAVDWFGIASGIGADVPVCLGNELTFMTGLGERLQKMPRLAEPLPAVLVNPLVAVPDDKTAQVFRALSASPLAVDAQPNAPAVRSLMEALDVIARTGNDLEEPARRVVPAVGEVLAALRSLQGCRVAAMSGAGPTCFGIFADPVIAAAQLKAAYPSWWIEAVEIA